MGSNLASVIDTMSRLTTQMSVISVDTLAPAINGKLTHNINLSNGLMRIFAYFTQEM